jgi:hypothetical protein
MSITIRGNTKINSRTRIGTLNAPPTPTPTPTPSGTFSFTFNQQWAAVNATVSSIGGFTSTPSFTPTSNAFTFNSTGSPLGTTTFSFTMTANITATITAELIQNSVILETINNDVNGGHTFVFTPIVVSQSDTIQILTYAAD